MNPPTARIIKMTHEDVHENLVDIIHSMDKIRTEAINSLGASDEQKQEYLRRTGELASCIEALSKDNPVLKQYQDAVNALLAKDVIVQKYDFRNADFWAEHEPLLQQLVFESAIAVLKDDFISESNAYHVFQAFKYLSKADDASKIYEGILPVGSLLSYDSLNNPATNIFLLRKILNVRTDGVGASANVDTDAIISSMESLGAMYVDLPKDQFSLMKKKFPRTVIAKKNGKDLCRVVFGSSQNNNSKFTSTLGELQEYASIDVGDVENDLVTDISNFYGFGKKFAEQISHAIDAPKREELDSPQKGSSKKSLPPSAGRDYGLDGKLIEVDEEPAAGGDSRIQSNWLKYWNNKDDGRVMMSGKDFYAVAKQLKAEFEHGSEEQKNHAIKVRKSLIEDFKADFIVLSTRIKYNTASDNSLEGVIVHNFKAKNPAFTESIEVENIPVYSSGTAIKKVLENDDGLKFLQAYFSTPDNAEAITQNLEFISNKKSGRIKVWTPDIDSRKSGSDRAAFLDYNGGDFRIDGYYGLLGNGGRSRGVSYSPPLGGGAPQSGTVVNHSTSKAIATINPSHDFSFGINKGANCVYFTKVQEIPGYTKYSGVFCAHKSRFALSAIINSSAEQEALDNKVSNILMNNETTADKLALLEQTINPVYAHIQRYELSDSKWAVKDDSELFREPSVVAVKGDAK